VSELTKAPMRSLVELVAEACEAWLDADELPSPPATAQLLRSTDRALAATIENLCRAYPQQLGCDRHPSGRSALTNPNPSPASDGDQG
jgi:hypothetical protein